MANDMATLQVRSLAFEHGGHIPAAYTCNGKGTNPPLEIRNYPETTKTLALIVEDPDAPNGTFTHWVAWNIPPNEPIAEGSVPGDTGLNSGGKEGYYPPCPPSGTYRYYFKAYALDTELNLPRGTTTKEQLQQAVQGHVIAQGELMGLCTAPAAPEP